MYKTYHFWLNNHLKVTTEIKCRLKIEKRKYIHKWTDEAFLNCEYWCPHTSFKTVPIHTQKKVLDISWVSRKCTYSLFFSELSYVYVCTQWVFLFAFFFFLLSSNISNSSETWIRKWWFFCGQILALPFKLNT